jgi:AcrR family transcriptional regulator
VTAATSTSDRKEEIVATSARLFAERGIAATSMRDIGRACGILGGSLYHHFASKDEIVNTITRRASDDLIARYDEALSVSADPVTQLETLIATSFRAIEAHPLALRLYHDERVYLAERPLFGYLADMNREHEQLWLRIVQDGMRAGVFRTDVHAERFARIAMDTVWSTARWWSRRAAEPLDDVVHDITTLLLHGIVPDGRGTH